MVNYGYQGFNHARFFTIVKVKKENFKPLCRNIKDSNTKGMFNLHISKNIEQGPRHQKTYNFSYKKLKP
jgi:hypothetical protein